MKSEKDKLSTALSGISGEYFVAAELSRHGLIAAVTLRNTRGIDILASRPGGKKPATIQVKTLQRGNKHWLLSKNDERSKGKHHYYVFVTLHGRNGTPEYHVVEGNTVARKCAASHRKWLKGRKRDGGKRKDSSMRIFAPGESFRDGWNRIRFD
ncbi:MAG: aspartate ammonia-lyase [Acidobacteriia bacterium]|nr:aspartate ammonia-lyase [Terriglobia bacterium]